MTESTTEDFVTSVTAVSQSEATDLSTQTTTRVPGPTPYQLPVLGLPGSAFYIIHYAALVSLLMSITVSTGVLVYLLASIRSQFYTKAIGERLVVYLCVCDLFYSISHTCDHVYMLITEDHPPDIECAVMAVFLLVFMLAQSIMVTFTAVNSFYMVVMEKRFDLGRYDWRLLLMAFGLPLVVMAILAGLGMLGPTGGWCMVDSRKPSAKALNTTLSLTFLLVIVANILSYFLVAAKLTKVGKSTGRAGKYDKQAKMLMVFVAVYILQYSALVVANLWFLKELPPIWLLVSVVTLTNLGGVFNFAAYTLMRRKKRRTENERGAAEQSQTTANTNG